MHHGDERADGHHEADLGQHEDDHGIPVWMHAMDLLGMQQ